MSPGLLRARAPYRIKNAVTGVLLGAFVVGVWAYSMKAVQQDVFDDVDEEAKQLVAAGTILPTIEDQDKTKTGQPGRAKMAVDTLRQDATMVDSARPILPLARHRGLLPGSALDKWLDPKHKTLVWGAPSIDNPGRMGKS